MSRESVKVIPFRRQNGRVCSLHALATGQSGGDSGAAVVGGGADAAVLRRSHHYGAFSCRYEAAASVAGLRSLIRTSLKILSFSRDFSTA